MAMRACGGCTLCCKLVPVPALAKPANQRCQHQRIGKGCAIYERRPASCRAWVCMWLVGPDVEDLRRPDRARYVIDSMPDFITLSDEATNYRRRVPCVQVWVDPAAPDAWKKDGRLMAWLERRAEQGIAALVRNGSVSGIAVFAPPLAPDMRWHFIDTGSVDPVEHNAGDVQSALDEAGIGWRFTLTD